MHVKLVLKIEFCTTDGTYVTNICSIYAEWSKNIIHNSGRITVAEIFHANYVLLFNIHGSVHRTNILIYITQHATLHSLFYLETALHVSGGTTTHHQERKHLYLQHLVPVTPLLLSAAVVEELELVRVCCGWRTPITITVWQIPDAVDTVVCAPDDGWWYHPKHVEQFPDKTNCVTLHLFGYILEY